MTRNSFKFDPFAEDALGTLKTIAAHFQEQSKNPKDIFPEIDETTIRAMQTHAKGRPGIYNAVAFHERLNHTLISLTRRSDILLDNIPNNIFNEITAEDANTNAVPQATVNEPVVS